MIGILCTQICAVGSAIAETPANPLDADRAFGYLEEVCRLGPRPSGSRAMLDQQKLVTEHFESLGAEVERQTFRGPNPQGGPKVRMANIIARWRPELKRRVLFCAHYDTRPLPDRDPNPLARRSGRFIGANDGASGVALLMELAHLMREYDGPVGIDLVLFDAEEFVWDDNRDPYFLGSRWFGTRYAKRKPKDWSYEWAILVDMVGDNDLEIHYEVFSWNWKETRPLVRQIWGTADQLGIKEFVPRTKTAVKDDHLALRQFGNIKAIDIIDIEYPHWHTEADVPRNCSGESLAKVGWVLWEWLQKYESLNPASE